MNESPRKIVLYYYFMKYGNGNARISGRFYIQTYIHEIPGKSCSTAISRKMRMQILQLLLQMSGIPRLGMARESWYVCMYVCMHVCMYVCIYLCVCDVCMC